MKNQKGRRVKMDIFGIFDKHFIRKKNLFGFLCSLKTNFKIFSGTVLFFMKIYTRMVNLQRSEFQNH